MELKMLVEQEKTLAKQKGLPPPPTPKIYKYPIKQIAQQKIVKQDLENVLGELDKRIVSAQTESKQLQQKLDNVMENQSKYDPKQFIIYVNKAKNILSEYDKYIEKTTGSKRSATIDLQKVKKRIKDVEEPKPTKKELITVEKWTVTYTKDGKTQIKEFDNLEEAKNFSNTISTPESIKSLMRSRIIKQTKIDDKVYYVLDKPVDKITPGQRRLLEEAGFNVPLPQKEAERYKKNLDRASQWMADLIYSDIADKKEAKRILKELEPIVATTVQYGPDPLEVISKKIKVKLSELERKAKYGEKFELGPGEYRLGKLPAPPEVIKARLAHIALSSAMGAAKASPILILGTVGGPIATGLLSAASIATLANPKNRGLINKYINEHPEQFIAELAGAVALGVGIGQVKSIYNKYKNQIPDLYQQQLEMQLATDVPDFPGSVIEPTTPMYEQFIFTKFLKGLSSEDAQKFLKSGDATLFFGAGDQFGRPMSVSELLELYPTLADPQVTPIYHPLVERLVPKYADLIKPVPGQPGMYAVPAIIAALSTIAKQGYITDEDIRTLIEQGKISIEAYEIKTDQLPWTLEDLSKITIPDATPIVESIEEPIIVPITTPVVESITEPITEPKIEPIIEPPPEEPPTKPKIEVKPLTKKEKEKMSKIRLQLYMGSKEKYRVKYDYPKGPSETLTFEARGFVDAVQKAQRARKSNRYLPSVVDVVRIQ